MIKPKSAFLIILAAAVLAWPVSLATVGASLARGLSSGAERVSAERIARHVQFLASERLQGRRAGSAGADQAAGYIEGEFKRYRLAPPSAAGFVQAFSFVSGVRLGETNRFQIKTPAGNRALKLSEEFMPLAFSSSDPASGEVVVAGYGISAPELQHDDYARLDVAAKVVMILRGSPDGDNPHGRFADFTAPGLEVQRKTLKAREKGARAVIFVSGEQNFREDSLSRLRHDLNFLDAGLPAAVVSRPAAESILSTVGKSLAEAEKLAGVAASFALDGVTAELKTDVVRINGKTANVVGVLKGSDPTLASEYVVIGAHYDHLGLGGPESLAQKPEAAIHHGADDNASGTSCLLELARVMSAERSKTKRSVAFIAFSGEELGLLGSAAYTKSPIAPLSSTVAMLNMDMVGRLRDGSLFVGGVGTSPAWKPLLDRLNTPRNADGSTLRFKLSTGQDGFGPSDHQSFYVRDIPVLFFFTGTHDDYHKPSDTAEKINAYGAGEVAELVREIALSVANEPQRIAFTRVKTESRPTGRGFRVYLGTVPNYSDQSEGLKLDGVRPGSPAERAGLRAGDVVVKLARVAIKNVYDYTYALGEIQAGVEIDVVIRRDGKEMSIKLTPEKRQ